MTAKLSQNKQKWRSWWYGILIIIIIITIIIIIINITHHLWYKFIYLFMHAYVCIYVNSTITLELLEGFQPNLVQYMTYNPRTNAVGVRHQDIPSAP